MAYLIALLGAAAVSLLWSVPVMLLWNWLMPALFGFKVVTWLQALGLSLLCGLLFNPGSSSNSK